MQIAYQKTPTQLTPAAPDQNGSLGLQTDLSRFNTGGYRGGPTWKMLLWYGVNYYVFDTAVPFPYRFKNWLLRLFGAKVGTGVIIKPHVRIKYPWRLAIGNHSWIGESVWVDNLLEVEIGNHVAISQSAHLLTGNHDYTDISFPYMLGKIVLEDGVWIGARAIVCPNVICRSHSILTVNSVANKSLDPWGIYAGNPARLIRLRKISGCAQSR